MILLFKVISVPLMDKRTVSKRPGNENYIKEVYALVTIKNLKKKCKICLLIFSFSFLPHIPE